ncbi:hypothetical protein ACJ73_10077 [Blastomyces percursus]|uniref:Uncharacterized protein n=1 Tax=Blastomyces percursus TaxID=1658174 RepID=A0A1J9P0D8_9EURO|nr:hypothetical protein ACJ73_10077 [Blastomyces percursus]
MMILVQRRFERAISRRRGRGLKARRANGCARVHQVVVVTHAAGVALAAQPPCDEGQSAQDYGAAYADHDADDDGFGGLAEAGGGAAAAAPVAEAWGEGLAGCEG